MNVICMDLPRKQSDQARLVQACDAAFDEVMEAVANRIASHSNLKLLGLAGPSCAGKTTAAQKLTEVLERKGHRVHTVSIDDFYFDKKHLEARADADPDIEIDYDSEDTIDADLLLQKTESLLLGRTTELPRFDFQTGERLAGKIISPQSDDVFLFEGIQILYPKVRKILMAYPYYSIYIAPRSSIRCNGVLFSPNRIRLMRRLVRDFRYRASQPSFTFYLWKSVRQNEEKSIFPYANTCDEQIDSTLPYEIGMLKPHLVRILEQIEEHDPYIFQAREILHSLQTVPAISSELLGEKSLYKEFI